MFSFPSLVRIAASEFELVSLSIPRGLVHIRGRVYGAMQTDI